MSIVASHGGSSSNPNHADGPELASLTGLQAIGQGRGALQAAVAATVVLEDDDRFNAGTGSNLRLDGITIQMDASCMTSDGVFSSVAAIERTKNPILVAESLRGTPHILLVGEGATEFARKVGYPDHDPTTRAARDRFDKVRAVAGLTDGWSKADLARAWNFATPLREALGSDTVGSVAWDGQTFAAALSSGGTSAALLGRVGDVPLPGCGLYAGPAGAIATTGDGEYIARSLLAFRAYEELARGHSAAEVVDWGLDQLEDDVDLGLIVINRHEFAGGARNRMAWHGCTT